MNLIRILAGIVAVVGFALLYGILIFGVPTLVVLLLLKLFGVI